MKKLRVFIVFVFGLAFLLLQTHSLFVEAEPEEPLAVAASSPQWETAEKISVSSGITAAIQPSLAASATGSATSWTRRSGRWISGHQ